jgi:hypothetical protein
MSKVKKTIEAISFIPKSNVELLHDYLVREINMRKSKCVEIQKKFDDDFLYAFKWYGEEMCINQLWIESLGIFIAVIEEEDESTIIENIEYHENNYKQYIGSSYNVRSNSTSPLDRELSIYRYQTFINILEFISKFKKYYLIPQ